ncbi:unnamed protein product (macronuclear) [Paramecium tetraurelia]|uniref:HAUS augmin-like complex subunit 6 N-terminal domain-containing protein n=1 Tax=Paramecium tetraurelia TaxID=5888 RepID=A0BNV6_PARTE|nr:uncharacterized protein GSPATT00030862001 [Paramecium tetraurelia]CAK60223.1 unnamed protein product [Paramecium tetraurelia]|eukprot:XP_001427621.1 hypothetical protein (macronuclear) [Paramecium tetraurelia strain d4-2]
MHYFKDHPTDQELIVNNLRLLNYDIKEANTTFRLNIEQLTIENMKAHPKLTISIIHFFVSKLFDDDSFINSFKTLYPPRTQIEQSVYKQEIAKFLKNSNKIPKNFLITKVMMDQRIFIFLRYISEFALRAQFLNLFPTKQLKTFYLDPKRLLIEDRPCINDCNDMFIISNYQFENLQNLNIPIQIIKILTGLIGHQILLQVKKLKKLLKENCLFIDSILPTIDQVSSQLKSERDFSLKLIQQLCKLIYYLRKLKERKLDRKPQLDQSYKVFNGIQNIIKQFQEQKMDINMNQIQSTIRLDKFCEEDNLNKLHEIHNNKISNLTKQVEKIEKETWVKDRGNKCISQSEDTLNKIKELKRLVQSKKTNNN